MSAKDETQATSKDTVTLFQNGDEPTELLKALAYEYIAELNRSGMCQLLETVGTNGNTVLLVVIPDAKVVDGEIRSVGTEKSA